MIDVTEQEQLFVDIGIKLPKKIEVYAIGGTAMMFLGLKKATLDIDLVFSNYKDRKVFMETAKSIGIEEMDSRVVYGKRENVPEVMRLRDFRIDLFLFKIITTDFSEAMQKRADRVHVFGGNLVVKIADVHDLIIMKSVTLREKDEDDIVSAINNSKIDWNIIIEEAQNQLSFGNERTILDLGTTFEKMTNQKKAVIPKEVQDKLWNLLKKQINEKSGKGKKKYKT